MRSEHRTTADEYNLDRYWRATVISAGKAGATKSVKARSHRHDRRISRRRAIADQLRDLAD